MEYRTTIYRKNTPLKAKIRVPDEDNTEPSPIVILCHGHSRYMDDGLDVLAASLANHGIGSIRFNFSGCGSDSPNRYRLYCGTDWLEDLEKVIDYVPSIPYFDCNKIGLAGISMGASTVLAVSGIDQRVKCTVAMAPVDDGYSWLKKVWEKSSGDWSSLTEKVFLDSIMSAKTGASQLIETLDMFNDTEESKRAHKLECLDDLELNNFVSLDSINNLLRYKPVDYCSSIQTPVFFINGAEDNLVPIECSENMKKVIKKGEVKHKIYDHVDHNIPISPHREEVFEDIVDWFSSKFFL